MKEGKCKYYGEKWDPRHICLKKETTKNLYQCEAKEEDKSDSDESDIEETRDIENPLSYSEDEETPKISIASITGIHQPQTLKLKGHIKNNNVVVLFDTGSIHNFIDVSVAKKLNLFIYPVPNMKVMVADGKKIKKVGNATKLSYKYKTITLSQNFMQCPQEELMQYQEFNGCKHQVPTQQTTKNTL